MALLFNGRIFNSAPYLDAEVNYEYTRDGANMKYHFWGRIYVESSTGWYSNNLLLNLYLNGSNVYGKNCQSSSGGWSIYFDSGWHTVSNKTSGTTPFYFTVKDTQNSGWCNFTSGTYQLTVAPAYTNITSFSVEALSETSVRFNWSTSNIIDYVWYSIDNGSNWISKEITEDMSGSFDINSLTDNTSYDFKIRVRRKDSQLTTDSNSYTTSTYSYPYVNSIPEFTVGDVLSIGIYNPLERSCIISIIGDDGTEYEGGTITSTSISGFNDNTWLDNWYKTLPNKTQGVYKVRLKCDTGDIDKLSSDIKYYLNSLDENFKPLFAINDVIDIVNTDNTDISGYDKFIKNHNSLSGVIKPMTAQRYSYGNYYNISSSGLATVKKDYSSSNIDFVLGNMTSNVFNITAVDSRGFTTTISKNIDLVDYNKPFVTSSKIVRQNGIGTKVTLTFSGEYTNWSGLLKDNHIQLIKYKIGSNGTWTSLPSDAEITNSNGIWTLNTTLNDDFAFSLEYDLYLQISDLLETITTDAYRISTSDAYIWKDLENKRFGIGKKPNHSLDVNGNINGNDILAKGSSIIPIDITDSSETLLSRVQYLGNNDIHIATWFSRTDEGTKNISDKPTGTTNTSFVCSAICNKRYSSDDYSYILECYVQGSSDVYKAVVDNTTQYIDWTNNSSLSVGDSLPIGTMLPYTSEVIPNGFLPCDGSEVSRTEYSDLFKVIGTSYGSGDGSTTFNLPDKRGRVSVGLDPNQTEFNNIGLKGGEKQHELKIEEMPSHNHVFVRSRLYYAEAAGNNALGTTNNGSNAATSTTNSTGGNKPHNNLQPYEVDQWIIKAFNEAYSQPVNGDVNDTLPVGSIVKFDGDYIPEGYEEVENPSIEFYTSGTSFIAKWDCYAEVFVTAYGWGYGGAEAYLKISKSGDPEVILEQFGKTRGHDTVPDCVTSFGVYKLKKGNTYQFTSGPFVPNGGTNATAGYVKLTPIN